MYGIKNLSTTNSIEVTLDLSSSENVRFSSSGPLVKKTLRAGELQFMLHASAGPGNHFELVERHSSKEVGKK